MTYQERKTVEAFMQNAEKSVEAQPVQTMRTALKYIGELCAYVDQLEREAKR